MKKSRTKSQFFKKIGLLLLLILSLTAIFWRLFSFAQPQETGKIKVRATLLQTPKVFDKWQYFDIDGYNIKAKSDTVYEYGNALLVEGETKDGRITDPKITKVGDSVWRKMLYQVRLQLKKQIDRALPQPASSLLAGLVLGIDDLPSEVEDSLRKSGTIHVVVVSGYNISVVAGLLLSLSRFVHRRFALALSLVGIVGYTLLVGAEPPAMRAAIMGSLTLLATGLGRQRYSLYTLFLAASLMTFLNPRIVGSVSFQLSFLATLGIILFQERITKQLQFLPFSFKEDLATTLAAQSLVVPILFYHFGSISAISPVANGMTLWIIPITTVLGFAFLLVSWLLWPLAVLIGWVIWAFLSIFTWAIDLFSKIPFNYYTFEPGNWWILLAYYLLLGSLVLFLNKVSSQAKIKTGRA